MDTKRILDIRNGLGIIGASAALLAVALCVAQELVPRCCHQRAQEILTKAFGGTLDRRYLEVLLYWPCTRQTDCSHP